MVRDGGPGGLLICENVSVSYVSVIDCRRNVLSLPPTVQNHQDICNTATAILCWCHHLEPRICAVAIGQRSHGIKFPPIHHAQLPAGLSWKSWLFILFLDHKISKRNWWENWTLEHTSANYQKRREAYFELLVRLRGWWPTLQPTTRRRSGCFGFNFVSVCQAMVSVCQPSDELMTRPGSTPPLAHWQPPAHCCRGWAVIDNWQIDGWASSQSEFIHMHSHGSVPLMCFTLWQKIQRTALDISFFSVLCESFCSMKKRQKSFA